MIQEALTNALKHSGGTAARCASTTPNDARGRGGRRRPRQRRAAPDRIGGHGLIGMRERVSLHGGHLRAGPDPADGFACARRFPLNGNAA